jgi:tetratricopeptide (TPR) repeat protein
LPYLLRSAEEQVRAFATLDHATDVQLAVTVAEEAGGEAQLGRALRMRGFLRRVKHLPEAEPDLRKAIELGERLNDSLAVAEAAKDLAGYFMRSGSAGEWEKFASKCLDAARRAGSFRFQVDALNMLAVHADSRGERARARELYESALAVAEKSGDAGLVGFLELSFGYFHLSVSEYQAAVEAFERAAKATLSRENTAILRSNLGLGYLELGRNADARRELDAALTLAQAIDLKPIEAEVSVRLGALDLRDGVTAGMARLEDGIALARSVKAVEQLVEGLWRKGVDLVSRDPKQARAALEEAKALATESGYYLAEVERALAAIKG